MSPPIRFTSFFGELPGLHPHKLPEQNAQLALKTRLWSGAIEPMRAPSLVKATGTVGVAQTIFRYDDTRWLEYSSKVSIVRPASPNDQHGRVLIFDGVAPKVTDSVRVVSGATLRLGVPAPETAPAGVAVGSPTDDNDLAETVFYVVTFENSYGEEGPPSPVSNEVSYKPGQSVQLTLPSVPAGAYDFVAKHIYRSVGGTAFQWIGEVPAGTSTYTDAYGSPAYEQLESTDWAPPPTDLEGAIALPNGAVAAFRNNELWISEPGLPHAWPHSYPVENKIVGLVAFGNSIAVITTHQPVIFTGVHPSSMSPTKPEIGYGCVSADSIVDLGYGAVYAAGDGLVMLSADGTSSVITDPMVFSTQVWRSMSPSTMKGGLWKQMYVCFHAGGAFVINPRQPMAGIVRLGEYQDLGARYTDEHTGQLYIVVGSAIGEFDGGLPDVYTWRSRPVELPRPGKIKVIQVLADAYPVDVTVVADGEVQASVRVKSEKPVRIPPPRQRVRTYTIEVSGQGAIREILGAQVMEELRLV